jgi:hypothetical protein
LVTYSRVRSPDPAPAADPYAALNIVDLSAVAVEPPKMLLDSLLVDGDYHSWYGPKSSGKTWVVAHVVAELLKRGECVVWIDKEMSAVRIRERLACFGVEDFANLVYMEMPLMDGKASLAPSAALVHRLSADAPAGA